MTSQKQLDMPDDALIRALGEAELNGAKTSHLKILAGQVSYLRTQLNVLANTFDPDGEEGIRDYVRDLHELSNKELLKIIK